ncbi:low affinity immunoglobulin gamma Fc region receptor II-a-like [Labrus mixtus]|uniref:low affinity immunoglobulin gamma Fc region receptor II-a-like n=1 Tax=Labrus mixtus TaxID=508554 RepID=UPI0029C0C320|nr:low affinity immunoglobulin gamma Fc region receptor II-a-like [Labrus mixtus]
MKTLYLDDNGQYWCESGDRKTSDIIYVTVTAGPVILESPISVVEGEDVTLRCRNKTTSPNPADFYKDGRLIRRSFTENMTIPGVTKRDEGLYKCTISGGGESAESLMAVEKSHQEIHTSSDLLFIIFRNLLPVVMMAPLLLLLGRLHCLS